MSRVRGVFPLFLATAFGIINGVWVFGPALREQRLEKDEQERKVLEVTRQPEQGEVRNLRDAEAATSRSVATDSALRPAISSGSWWSTMSRWSKGSNGSDEGGNMGDDNTANQNTKE